MLLPLKLMLDRVERARTDSDTALFHELLYAGELVVKITTATFVAAVQEDRDSHRYRLLHSLIRADGLGDWATALDDALVGPASQSLLQAAKEDRRALTERVGPETWQHQSVALLQTAVHLVQSDAQPIPSRLSLRAWFGIFAELRNKTRAHGAPTAAYCSAACPAVEQSIALLCENLPIFCRQWAYLHRNLSGRYRVVPLSDEVSSFDYLKSRDALTLDKNLEEGVYVFMNAPCPVELLRTNLDCADFFVPNGAFNGRRFELHSPITDSRLDGDARPYLAPASDRPTSETEGLGQLEVFGRTFANLPRLPTDYVSRPGPEREIAAALTNDRHPIVTLVGRGGIGKTSLALTVLDNIATTDRFTAMIWFSARDIDLTASGPKVVKPKVLSEQDIADQFVELLGPKDAGSKDFRPVSYMAENMRASSVGGPILYVFDNFETVRSPVDLFQWIDTNIRLPNKVLITSRFRDFKADFPIEIEGMDRGEAETLINRTAQMLGCSSLLSAQRKEQIFDAADGHPYVMKIILGEIASAKSMAQPERIVARKDDILDALFDRTFSSLTPAAKRVFLTLSAWRSMVPSLALEAVLLREQAQIDPAAAVDELVRMSLVQRVVAPDDTDFLDVPLSAAIFAQKKLSASPVKEIILNDVKLLQDLGPTTRVSLKEGVQPRIRSIFQKVARRIAAGNASIDEIKPILEFIARSYPPAWLLLADLYQESFPETQADTVAEYLRRFLEAAPNHEDAGQVWERLAHIYKVADDPVGAVGAFMRAYASSQAPLSAISNVAQWLNSQHPAIAQMDPTDKASLFKGLAGLMENRLHEAGPTDLSRLAWLHLHSGDTRRARALADLGLRKDPSHRYCQRVIERLSS